MAQSVNINQRIVLIGGDEVRQQLENISKAGQNVGENVKRSLTDANVPLVKFGEEAKRAGAHAGNARLAILEFGAAGRGVVDSFAAGLSPLRIFAEESGRIVQAFAFGGGVRNVLGEAAKLISGFITPTKLATVGIAALTAGIGFLINRITNDTTRIKEFGAILHGLGLGTGVPGNLAQTPTVLRGSQGLEAQARLRTPSITGNVSGPALLQSAKNLRDVSLSTDEAIIKLQDALRKLNNVPNLGLSAKGLEQFVRTGEQLNIVLGKGSAERYITALSQIGTTLKPIQDIAKEIRVPVTGFEDANTLIAEIRNQLKNTPILFDPIAIKTHEINVGFQQLLDTATGKLQTIYIKSFEAAQRFPINFPQAFKNAYDSANALDDVLNSIADKVQRSSGFKNFVISADALDGLINSFADATGRGLSKGLHNLIITADALDGLLNSLADVAVRGFSRGFHNLVITADAFDSLADSLASAIRRGLLAGFANIGSYISPVTDAIQQALHGDVGALFRSAPTIPAPSIVAPDTGVTAQDLTAAGFALGGLARGSGSGTSDSILARISNGEFIVNATATRANLPILEAINSMNRPIRSNRGGFAAGGLVVDPGAVDARTRFTLVIEGRHYFGIDAPDSTVNALLKHAQTSTMISAGPSPSWTGGR